MSVVGLQWYGEWRTSEAFASLKNRLTYQCPSSWLVVITMKKKLAGTSNINVGY
jgi:hypothetical protein